MNDSQINQILQIATSTFSELGITESPIETILCCDLCYVGKKYTAGGWKAIWLVERNAIEIFDPEGELVKNISVSEDLNRAA